VPGLAHSGALRAGSDIPEALPVGTDEAGEVALVGDAGAGDRDVAAQRRVRGEPGYRPWCRCVLSVSRRAFDRWARPRRGKGA
jgi:hypothetical protein